MAERTRKVKKSGKSMNTQFFIFFLLALVLLISDLVSGRAIALGPNTFFPNRKKEPIMYWIAVSLKGFIAIVCLYYTFTVPS